MKEFADDNFKFDKNRRKLSKQVKNTVEKGEIARYEQFLLFPQCFQKACFPEASKGVIVWGWVKEQLNNLEGSFRAYIETCTYQKSYIFSMEIFCRTVYIKIRLHILCSLILIYSFQKTVAAHQPWLALSTGEITTCQFGVFHHSKPFPLWSCRSTIKVISRNQFRACKSEWQ